MNCLVDRGDPKGVRGQKQSRLIAAAHNASNKSCVSFVHTVEQRQGSLKAHSVRFWAVRLNPVLPSVSFRFYGGKFRLFRL